jgi:hypothetical protein
MEFFHRELLGQLSERHAEVFGQRKESELDRL